MCLCVCVCVEGGGEPGAAVGGEGSDRGHRGLGRRKDLETTGGLHGRDAPVRGRRPRGEGEWSLTSASARRRGGLLEVSFHLSGEKPPSRPRPLLKDGSCPASAAPEAGREGWSREGPPRRRSGAASGFSWPPRGSVAALDRQPGRRPFSSRARGAQPARETPGPAAQIRSGREGNPCPTRGASPQLRGGQGDPLPG